jgi:hypothetical protein
MYTQPQTATEWADDANQMLVTYSPNPNDVLAFAAERGALGGIWIERTGDRYLVAENGWVIANAGGRFFAVDPRDRAAFA